MTALKPITVAALVALLAFPALADVSGPACVTDGDTLVVNAKRQRTPCVGGTRVRLFGIDAPELKQKCKYRSVGDFPCGRSAASFLLEHVRGSSVECKGTSVDRDGHLIATCFIDGKNLNAMMVSAGWALAYRDYSTRYVPQENAAREARRGIWAMQFVPPWKWRRGERSATALREYRPLAEQGDASAQFVLGSMYYTGTDVPRDYAEAVKWFRKAAEQGQAKAQYSLGVMYDDGQGVPQDDAEAVKWFRKAAEQGYARAQNNLGFMYRNGKGVPQDYAEAVKWYRKAAEQGYAIAQNNLGLMYGNGEGVPQDYAEAVKWSRKAAEQGYARAQNNLGFMYSKGQGVPQDYVQAVKWYHKAAEQGYAKAQFSLGLMYGTGLGVPQDHAEAGRWYRKAAEQGYADAQFSLGLMYGKGLGVPQDYVQAHKWYNLAAMSLPPGKDHDTATKNREIVAKTMTPAQVSEAQKLAREWKPK